MSPLLPLPSVLSRLAVLFVPMLFVPVAAGHGRRDPPPDSPTLATGRTGHGRIRPPSNFGPPPPAGYVRPPVAVSGPGYQSPSGGGGSGGGVVVVGQPSGGAGRNLSSSGGGGLKGSGVSLSGGGGSAGAKAGATNPGASGWRDNNQGGEQESLALSDADEAEIGGSAARSDSDSEAKSSSRWGIVLILFGLAIGAASVVLLLRRRRAGAASSPPAPPVSQGSKVLFPTAAVVGSLPLPPAPKGQASPRPVTISAAMSRTNAGR